ncbi:hypothetical protein [Defluviicoccus vanus]|uniref:Uncharacterized protein n=1 Tax=Defluviicoccus vanus TaxID=111831 RepID=A0A7H1N3C0_9PROT|nr:hypothetical protein [Defluviicoccus vanus]QNT70206.1 hypothetical protein HQ394_13835 [Defluviicoccus vanus]
MKRLRIILVSAAAVVAMMAAGGWWYAQRETAQAVRRMFIDADLVGRVAYGSTSYNPLTGVVSIHDVRPVGDEESFPITLGTLEIIDWKREADLVAAAHVKLVDLRINVLDVARRQFEEGHSILSVRLTDPPAKILQDPLQALVVLGYRDLTGHADVDYQYDPGDAALQWSISFGFARMGELRLHVGLDGIKPKLIRTIAEIANQASTDNPLAALGGMAMLSGQKKAAEQIGITDFGLSYVDEGLVNRYKQYYDVHRFRLPGDPSQLELNQSQVGELTAQVLRFGLPEDTARSSVEAIARFSKQPRRLVLRTNIVEPIRLTRIVDGWGDPKAVSKLVFLTGAEVTN